MEIREVITLAATIMGSLGLLAGGVGSIVTGKQIGRAHV